MHRARRRFYRDALPLVLVVLLLAPLALRAHWHQTDEAAPPCGVCVAALHPPGLLAPGPIGAAPLVRALAVPPPPVRGHWCDGNPRPTGRAPPPLPGVV